MLFTSTKKIKIKTRERRLTYNEGLFEALAVIHIILNSSGDKSNPSIRFASPLPGA